jgi:hypothetical protein
MKAFILRIDTAACCVKATAQPKALIGKRKHVEVQHKLGYISDAYFSINVEIATHQNDNQQTEAHQKHNQRKVERFYSRKFQRFGFVFLTGIFKKTSHHFLLHVSLYHAYARKRFLRHGSKIRQASLATLHWFC